MSCTLKTKRRFAVFVSILAIAFSCFSCAGDGGKDGGGEQRQDGLKSADVIEADNASVAFEKKSDTNKMAFDGVTVRSDKPYEGKIKGVFGASGEGFVLRFGFLSEAWNYKNYFEFTFSDVSDASVSFSLVFEPWYVPPTVSDPAEKSGFTGSYMKYKDLRLYRHDTGDIRDGYGTGSAEHGEYTRICPNFSSSWGSDTGAKRLTYGAISLLRDDYGYLHLRTLESSDNPTVDTFANMKDLAVFDGSDVAGGFAAGDPNDRGDPPCIRWGLPRMDFSDGFVVSFRTLVSSPDVYFTAIENEETVHTGPLCDCTKSSLSTEPEFYGKYKKLFE